MFRKHFSHLMFSFTTLLCNNECFENTSRGSLGTITKRNKDHYKNIWNLSVLHDCKETTKKLAIVMMDGRKIRMRLSRRCHEAYFVFHFSS